MPQNGPDSSTLLDRLAKSKSPFRVKSQKFDKYLSLTPTSSKGVVPWLEKKNDLQTQLWTLKKGPTGNFKIENFQEKNKFLAMGVGRDTNKYPVVVAAEHDVARQWWGLELLKNGIFTIRAPKFDKYLEASPDNRLFGASKKNVLGQRFTFFNATGVLKSMKKKTFPASELAPANDAASKVQKQEKVIEVSAKLDQKPKETQPKMPDQPHPQTHQKYETVKVISTDSKKLGGELSKQPDAPIRPPSANLSVALEKQANDTPLAENSKASKNEIKSEPAVQSPNPPTSASTKPAEIGTKTTVTSTIQNSSPTHQKTPGVPSLGDQSSTVKTPPNSELIKEKPGDHGIKASSTDSIQELRKIVQPPASEIPKGDQKPLPAKDKESVSQPPDPKQEPPKITAGQKSKEVSAEDPKSASPDVKGQENSKGNKIEVQTQAKTEREGADKEGGASKEKGPLVEPAKVPTVEKAKAPIQLAPVEPKKETPIESAPVKEAVKDGSKEVSKEPSKEPVKESPKDPPKEVTKNDLRDASNGLAKDVSKVVPKDPLPENSKRESQGEKTELPRTTPSNSSQRQPAPDVPPKNSEPPKSPSQLVSIIGPALELPQSIKSSLSVGPTLEDLAKSAAQFYIRPEKSDLLFTLKTENPTNTPIFLDKKSNCPCQLWTLSRRDNRQFSVVNVKHPGVVLGFESPDALAGASLISAAKNDQAIQNFTITPHDDSLYIFRNAKTQLVLEVGGDVGKVGTMITQQSQKAGAPQRFHFDLK